MSLLAQQDVAEVDEAESKVDRDVAEISQFRLMARRFKKSKLAVISAYLLVFMYVCMIFSSFLSPNSPQFINANATNLPPAKLTFANGGLATCGRSQTLDQATLTYSYKIDCNTKIPIQIFGKGFEYKLFGVIPTSRHLLTVKPPETLYLWGADSQGRDVFSRSLAGSRVSLTIGILSVILATFVAAVFGTASGYFGGAVDNIIQRVAEVIMSIPTLPLWLVLAAILPKDMSVTSRYLMISLILTVVGWPGLARQVRAKVMAYAHADYVNAARVAGSGHSRIIATHLLPNTVSHLVAVACLSIPGTIAAETSLSFLGVGMQEPAVSWGVLLQAAQKVDVVVSYPWILIPAILVIVAVTAFQLLGDGLRDAVDPYG